jgi:Fur family zinc uptake transcriptional regulator
MTVTCLHTPTSPPRGADEVERLVAAAVARAEAAGERMTEGRQRVLEMLLTAGEPVKAYDLIARFHTDGRVAKPASVYRSLDFLEKMGLLHRISSISSYVACSGDEHQHAAAFLICDCCGQTREIAPPQEAALRAAAASNGFSFDRVTLEVHGRCPDCRKV